MLTFKINFIMALYSGSRCSENRDLYKVVKIIIKKKKNIYRISPRTKMFLYQR